MSASSPWLLVGEDRASFSRLLAHGGGITLEKVTVKSGPLSLGVCRIWPHKFFFVVFRLFAPEHPWLGLGPVLVHGAGEGALGSVPQQSCHCITELFSSERA